jgi:CheY-like chemotaxis protein
MDDDETIRDSLSALLTYLGYQVERASSGAEAVQIFAERKETQHSFDLVVLDLTVPGEMGGKEAMQRLREIDPEIKGIVSSGYSNDPVMADFRKYGFGGFVSKPYKMEELSNVVVEVMMAPPEDGTSKG